MAYGEFEFTIAQLLGYAIPGGDDTAARLLYRVNGEAARLDVADALLRPFFETTLRIAGAWTNTLGALRYCKNVRNQYAHCHWHNPATIPLGLCFLNMDHDADSPEGTLNVHFYPTDLLLLQKQHEYFEYTLDWLFYLQCACWAHVGKNSRNPRVPKSIPQPPLHNLQKKRPAMLAAGATPEAGPEGSSG